MTSESGTFWNLVEGAVLAQPERVVLSDDYGRALTTTDLRDAALQTAAALADVRVKADTVVSWQLPTMLETMVVMCALTRLGAVQNPIIPLWRENEVRHALGQIRTEVFVVPREWRGFDHLGLARQMSDEFGVIPVALDLDGPPTDLNLRLPEGKSGQLEAASS